MYYEWTCPDCKKTTSGCTTGSYEYGDKIECDWCGRVSKVINKTSILDVEITDKKVSPTKLEELEALKKEKQNG